MEQYVSNEGDGGPPSPVRTRRRCKTEHGLKFTIQNRELRLVRALTPVGVKEHTL